VLILKGVEVVFLDTVLQALILEVDTDKGRKIEEVKGAFVSSEAARSS
jgi:hypothetical protein